MTFSDDETRELLRLLWKYCQAYAPDIPVTIPALAEDLAMSLNETKDYDDERRREIEELCA